MIHFDNREKFRCYIKKEASKLNISVNSTYKLYFNKILLKLIADAGYQKFIVNGSMVELAHLGYLTRAISDIDIDTIDGYENNIKLLENCLKKEESKGYKYEINREIRRSQNNTYQLPINVTAANLSYLLSIDYHPDCKEIIHPTYVEMKPIFEGEEQFSIYAKSIEEFLAEKICILFEEKWPAKEHIRIKDFYDIYNLFPKIKDKEKLNFYIELLLKNRKRIALRDISSQSYTKEFIDTYNNQWENIKRRLEFTNKDINFDSVVKYSREILDEQIEMFNQKRRILTPPTDLK